MLFESCLDNLPVWEERRRLYPEHTKLVCVMRHYPVWKAEKGAFDLVATSLAPPKPMLKRYQLLSEKYQNVAHGMRAWGKTLEEKKFTARCKAFVDSFGPNAVYFRRYLRRNPNAREAMGTIKRWLREKATVVLFCHECEPPCHRYILMSIILGIQKLERMFKQMKGTEREIAFARYVQGRYGYFPLREV